LAFKGFADSLLSVFFDWNSLHITVHYFVEDLVLLGDLMGRIVGGEPLDHLIRLGPRILRLFVLSVFF
jgi:hypothetical protein